MPKNLRLDLAHGADPRRWVVGLAVSSACTRLEAALVTATGHGLELRAELAGAKVVPAGAEIASRFAKLTAAGASESSASVAALRTRLAQAEADAVAELLTDAGVASSRIQVVAVHDPGLWHNAAAGPGDYLGLCDAARLAELTGMNIVDAFADRDLALGGQGGPVTAVALWLLLRDPNRHRLLLDLGHTLRMTYLPASHDPTAPARILCFDVGPGTRLLDLLTYRLTSGQQRFDPRRPAGRPRAAHR